MLYGSTYTSSIVRTGRAQVVVIVTGLSGQTTQALVATGVDLGGIHAVADLQRGIEEAQRLL